MKKLLLFYLGVIIFHLNSLAFKIEGYTADILFEGNDPVIKEDSSYHIEFNSQLVRDTTMKKYFSWDNNGYGQSYVLYKLHNGIWKKESKYYFDTNTPNQQSHVHSRWNADVSEFIPDFKITYFTENQNTTEKVRFDWSAESNSWKETEKEVYKFNGAGKQTAYYSIYIDFDTQVPDSLEKKLWYYPEGKDSSVYYNYDGANNLWKANTIICEGKENDLQFNYSLYYNNSSEQWSGSKEEKILNDKGEIIFNATYSWVDDIKKWKGVSKTVFNFHPENLNYEEFKYIWNNTYFDWEGNYRYYREYNADKLLTLEIKYLTYSMADKSWQPTVKMLYEYDHHKNLTKEQNWSWDNGTNSWKFYSSTLNSLTVNSNGKVTENIIYQQDESGNIIGATGKLDYLYNNNDQMLSKIESEWNSVEDKFIPIAKEEWTYDTQGNNLINTNFRYENPDNWIEVEKKEYIYDYPNNNKTLYSYIFDSESNQLVNFMKSTSPIDHNHLVTFNKGYYWNSAKNMWSGIYSNLIVRNESGQAIEIRNKAWNHQNDMWVIQSDQYYQYLPSSTRLKSRTLYGWFITQELRLLSHIEIYYSEPVVTESFVDIKKTIVYVYPNPASDYIYINESKFTHHIIYSSEGQEKGTYQENRIDIKDLSEGVYIIKSYSGNDSQVQRFVKK
ncbi:MAG: T9SS type A sorting domain-containing protein [Cytophagaceae bacterium]